MNIKRLLSFFAASMALIVSVTVLSSDTSAQGRFVNQYSKADVSDIIKRMEEGSDEFRTDFRRQMNNNNNLDRNTKNRFNGYVAANETSIDALRRHFNNQSSWWNSRSQVQSVISASQNVNTMMVTLPFRNNLERQWTQLRDQINRVADTYDLPGLNGGGWNGGGGGWNPGNPGGGQTSKPPSWAVGTFYASGITITISSNGQITAVTGGQTYYGRYYQNQIFLNNDTSTVSRNGNGIRTYNRNTGQTTNYSRNNSGGGNDGGWDNGQTSNPPSWARGTFRGNGLTMTIASNGRITVVTGGQTFYGRFVVVQIYLNNDVSTVSRNGNGIRTYNTNTGQTSNYSRN